VQALVGPLTLQQNFPLTLCALLILLLLLLVPFQQGCADTCGDAVQAANPAGPKGEQWLCKLDKGGAIFNEMSFNFMVSRSCEVCEALSVNFMVCSNCAIL
jgi:hypothetical protein